MLTITVTEGTLDQVLALQIMVAWAGEGICEPKRLDWWRTDLIDEYGGGDLFGRLFSFTGTLINNPYFHSVGLNESFLEQRLRNLPGISFNRMGELYDFGWQYADLKLRGRRNKLKRRFYKLHSP